MSRVTCHLSHVKKKIIFFFIKKVKNNFLHVTGDMWHVTHDTWHMTCTTWHIVWNENSLKISAVLWLSKSTTNSYLPKNLFFKSRIRKIPTLSTVADSRTDTNLKKLHDLSHFLFYFIIFLRGCMIYLNFFLFFF